MTGADALSDIMISMSEFFLYLFLFLYHMRNVNIIYCFYDI